MKLIFPKQFFFGTSTSAAQVETAFRHDWQGLKSRDGYTFGRTTDHETHIEEDVEIIASLAPHYRMSLLWSRLQSGPYADLDPEAVEMYDRLLRALRAKGVGIMMVLHHFVNPQWFAESGGWSNKKNIDVWVDYARKVVDRFGEYVSNWNTFNEPNLYVTFGYLAGEFPPFRKNPLTAATTIRNMGTAHDKLYDYIKGKFPSHPVGSSHNCAVFAGSNLFGRMVASVADWWYMRYTRKFFLRADFTGISYYARLAFDPFPVSWLNTPDKLAGRQHDDIWEIYPEGLAACIRRFHRQEGKPVIITENGVCTEDDNLRIRVLKDYMNVLHDVIDNEKLPILGYYHWSTWDNFEWTLGPTFRFGLYHCDYATMTRSKKPSAEIYTRLAFQKEIDIGADAPGDHEGTKARRR